jgi:hypothetical protein
MYRNKDRLSIGRIPSSSRCGGYKSRHYRDTTIRSLIAIKRSEFILMKTDVNVQVTTLDSHFVAIYINCAENGMNRNTFFYLEISSMNKVGILFPDDFITQDEDEE